MAQVQLRSWLLLLSMLAALVTIGLKSTAYWLTGSVGLLSEALESVVNLVAAGTVYVSLRYAARPVDASHTYGHEKIEYFSSGLEGVLIMVAAGAICWYALTSLFAPRPLEALGLGAFISLLAAGVNGAVGLLLLREGKRHGSIAVEADGRHLLTDVWTTGGVLLALGLVHWTGWSLFDPIVALVVVGNILWTGGVLVRRSFDGLMDHAVPEAEQDAVRDVIEAHLGPDMDYHALRTRQAGSRRFVDFHLLVPGVMTVKEAHALIDRIERALEELLPLLEVTIHVEPIEERTAWEDSALVPLEEKMRQRRAERLARNAPTPLPFPALGDGRIETGTRGEGSGTSPGPH
jgi:cation diffusion facilitator family transporter